ncbi:unnamed protein product [Allacma fusca]|uniref:UBR-type domain-containing protein n=1 Tax=Allacma fusca TaxID=39272 RepID=A0A8J2JRB6_9HEXA|nr:unnamed protein product [Allacma fusca]
MNVAKQVGGPAFMDRVETSVGENQRKVAFKDPNYQRTKLTQDKKRAWRSLKQIITLERSMPWDKDSVHYSSIDAPPSLKPAKKYSDISGLPAKYRDPHTNILYALSDEYQIFGDLILKGEMADDKPKSQDSDSDLSETEEAYTLDELGEMYESANAVLGASDPNNCSYSLGYVKRQALYACVTCNGPDAEKAGVCLGCANKCHENHQLVELYTKRVFRCDCGNKKFQNACLLLPEKDAFNTGNVYNHNFSGLYCTCERPYPDPDDDDEMIQCIICEDWYHSRHSFGHHSDRVTIGDGSDIDCEMICEKCTSSCDFLKFYDHLRVPITIKPELASGEGSPNKEDKSVSEKSADQSEATNKTNELKIEIDDSKNESSQETGDSGIVMTDSNEANPELASVDTAATNNGCFVKSRKESTLPQSATLWVAGWRSKLCKCELCLNMYFKLGVGFITDDEDTLFAYEALGQAKLEEEEKEKEEEFTSMWSKLDHVTKVEAMISFNEMKEHLREFLLKHNGKVFRKRDAEEFAEELKAKRAKRVGHGIPPNSCR